MTSLSGGFPWYHTKWQTRSPHPTLGTRPRASYTSAGVLDGPIDIFCPETGCTLLLHSAQGFIQKIGGKILVIAASEENDE